MKLQHRFFLFLIGLLLVSLLTLITPTRATGGNCLGCTIGVRVIYQFMEQEEPKAEKALFKLCDMLPSVLSGPCKIFVSIEGPKLIEMLQTMQSPDTICQYFKFCTNPQCLMYPQSSSHIHGYRAFDDSSSKFSKSVLKSSRLSNNGDPWWKKLLDIIQEPFRKMASDHLPLIDPDKDGFTDTFTFRGSAWRGKDCDNNNREIYPGRKVGGDYDARVDRNCNGIFGVDPQTQKPFEELLCSGTFRRGVAVLGDSGTAHFRIPPQIVTKGGITLENLKHMWELVQNEADYPHLSTVTGYMNDTSGLTPGIVDSIYLRLKQRNRCIHRDFQNIGVNGASSFSVLDIMHSFRRNQTHDEPVLMFVSLIGNDVCGSTARYTTVEQFYANIIQVLNHLDTVLPPQSFVVFVGLAQGDLLYEYLKDRSHPIGTTYPDLYNFMNCLETSPCFGWMNTNSTVRDITSKRAEELSKVYDRVIADTRGRYKNFGMAYHKFPLVEMAQEYIESGGDPADLIEPFDGFHPSQLTTSLVAKSLFEWLEKEHPEALGPINPFNAQIDQLFGDQGGH